MLEQILPDTIRIIESEICERRNYTQTEFTTLRFRALRRRPISTRLIDIPHLQNFTGIAAITKRHDGDRCLLIEVWLCCPSRACIPFASTSSVSHGCLDRLLSRLRIHGMHTHRVLASDDATTHVLVRSLYGVRRSPETQD